MRSRLPAPKHDGADNRKLRTDNFLTASQNPVDAVKTLATINPANPLYQNAEYRDDLTRRDEVMIRTRYGAGAQGVHARDRRLVKIRGEAQELFEWLSEARLEEPRK